MLHFGSSGSGSYMILSRKITKGSNCVSLPILRLSADRFNSYRFPHDVEHFVCHMPSYVKVRWSTWHQAFLREALHIFQVSSDLQFYFWGLVKNRLTKSRSRFDVSFLSTFASSNLDFSNHKRLRIKLQIISNVQLSVVITE